MYGPGYGQGYAQGYAQPRAWMEGAMLVVPKGSRLAELCVKCARGGELTTMTNQVSHNAAAYVPVVRAFTRQYASVWASYCPACAARLESGQRLLKIAWVILAVVWIGCGSLGAIDDRAALGLPEAVKAVGGFFVLVSALFVIVARSMVVQPRGIRAVRIDPWYVWLLGVHGTTAQWTVAQANGAAPPPPR